MIRLLFIVVVFFCLWQIYKEVKKFTFVAKTQEDIERAEIKKEDLELRKILQRKKELNKIMENKINE